MSPAEPNVTGKWCVAMRVPILGSRVNQKCRIGSSRLTRTSAARIAARDSDMPFPIGALKDFLGQWQYHLRFPLAFRKSDSIAMLGCDP